MKLKITGEDRHGITAEMLVALSRLGYGIAAMEVAPNRVHIDIPKLSDDRLPIVEKALLGIPGIETVSPVDQLPGEREGHALRTVLDSITDPVLYFDRRLILSLWNKAAHSLLGANNAALSGAPMKTLLGHEVANRIVGNGATGPWELMMNGAPFYAEPGPAGDGGLLITLRPAARTGRLVSALDARTGDAFAAILGDSAAMRSTKQRAQRLAGVEAPLLIQGDTGTGKELFARACHAESRRSTAAFLALNCAAVPENLAESELFGYAPGAFSGAARDGKPGLVELAEGGTLFLDEIGELSIYLQAKLLRFLQDGTYRRIGGRRERRSDVRIIAATNRDLEKAAAHGEYREDLYYRLAVLTLTLPALGHRREDIPDLSRAFIERAAAQIGCPTPELTAEAEALLCTHPWPGNVRQLESTIFRAVSLCDEGRIQPSHLLTGGENATTDGAENTGTWHEAVAAFEADLLGRLYPRYPSTRKLAARLGITHTTVADKLRKYRINTNNGV